MKQISKILFIIIMLVSLAYANQYKFPIQAFEFENMVWVFTKGDETFKVKFGKGGIIEGYPRSDLVRWEIKDGFLLLMGKNNSLAVKFDSYNLENDGWTLLGVSLVDGYKPAVLKEGSGDVVKSKQEKQKSFESGGDAIVRSDSDVYVENQKITVEFYNLPGNQNDWITIVPHKDPDSSYKEWYYTKGVKTGKMVFNGLPSGKYEIRVFYDWPNGGYKVMARHPITVIAKQSEVSPVPKGIYLRTTKDVYKPNERIVVEYFNMPGNKTDWITIVPLNDPDNTYKEWYYTNGYVNGRMEFNGLQSGVYEVRVFYDWPNGGYKVMYRHSFSVLP